MLLSKTLSCYFGSAVVFVWISLARSQCSPSTLMATCQGVQRVTSYLENDIQPSEVVTIPCNSPSGTLRGWSHAPGTAVVTDLLDTSPSKYMVNGNTLTIANINRTDEGVYRCIYDQGNTIEQCIYIYGRAMFTSCPNQFVSCSDNVSLSVVDGGSVRFDATVTHTPGGSCGFRQRITNVQLMKINPKFEIDDELLLSCDTESVTCSNSRVSLSRGNDPGYGFVFTLNNASLGRDDGMYRVDVQVTHPTTSSSRPIMKSFTLEVTPRPTTDGTPGEPDSPTTTTVTITDDGAATDTMEQRGSPPNLRVIIGVLVAVVLILISIAVAIVIVFSVIYRWRKSNPTDPPGGEKAPESHIIAQEENRDDGREEKVLFSSHEEQPPPYYAKCGAPNLEQLNMTNNKEPVAIEPTLYDNRCSLIESDFHLPADSYLNSAAELVTICEGDESEHASRNR